MKINLSIIIPVYEAKNTLLKSLKSINNQVFQQDLVVEVILIIDDGKNYKNIIPRMSNSIKVKILSTRGIKTGPGNARNIGLCKARGKYIGFLDADDEWSKNYLEIMYNAVKVNKVVFAPTRFYENDVLVRQFEGIHRGYLQLNDIAQVPSSFHPFIEKALQKKFKKTQSQDVYNAALILFNYGKIKMVENAYYKLNFQRDSVTAEKGFSHKVELAYKKYQLISIKERKIKLARVFAIRRLKNKGYKKWVKENNKSYYHYLKENILF